MNILGISAFYHDSAACLVRDGKIVAAAQEERFTRKKHDASFPENAIDYCLKSQGLSLENIDYVAFYEKPFLKFERILETYLSFAPLGIKSFLKSMPLWIKEKIWIKDIIEKKLKPAKNILFVSHHQSHAASAFFASPFQEAAILVMDAVGEKSTTTCWLGKNNEMEMVSEINFPHSLGMLYSAFAYFCGFKVNSGEYKLMGLAPYGQPKYKNIILSELIDLKEDGSFKMNMDYFGYCTDLKMTNKKFEKLFGGPARKPESPISQREADLAKSIQDVTDEIVLKTANYLYQLTGQKNLCMAGGVALNCVANSKILEKGLFENIWIQPASGDAGGALGAAMSVWHQYLGNKRITDEIHDFQNFSLLGPEFNNQEIQEFLEDNKIPFTKFKEQDLPEKIADLINEQKVIGIFRGRMEFGPRALGNRSIIGDPRSPKMQKIMNLKIKFRESFRPFAPSVLAEESKNFFDLDVESPYMLLTAPLKKIWRLQDNKDSENQELFKLNSVRSTVPAITHVDFSARIQTVTKESNPFYHNLICAFFKKYGCPMIINTSFNVRGEPIVCQLKDAYSCFIKTNMDYLLIGDFLLDKNDQKSLENSQKWIQNNIELD